MSRGVSLPIDPSVADTRRAAATPARAFASLDALPADARRRLRPPLTHKRWYVMRQLGRCIQGVLRDHRDDFDGATVIDLGCGDMPYRGMITPLASAYLGYDLPGNPAADGAIDQAGRIDRPGASADVVISTQVLEHVDSPGAYLAEARRLLKPGGLLLLSTHGVWWYHPHPQDLWRWTGPGLERLLRDNGFDVKERRGVMNLASAGVYLAQDGTYGRLPKRGPWRGAFFAVMQLIAAAADRLGVGDRDRMAAVFVTVSRKSA